MYYLAIKGKSSVTVLHELLVKVFWLCKAYGIKWEVVWVPREWNQVADDRTEQAGETRLHPAGCNLLNHNNKLHIIQNFILDEDNIPKT